MMNDKNKVKNTVAIPSNYLERTVKCVCSCKKEYNILMLYHSDFMHIESCSSCHRAYNESASVVTTGKSKQFKEKYNVSFKDLV